ncbi:zinc finger BED domain-containing protein 4-like isoform X4 [Acanthochromis polyacanthus]|uniref:zinc finger BED domain-containing protein 4-like isoform X3 n=1 Tax=Acanthochromis polyacanthus TaxID=80966 RepID=UPI002234B80E|nr:zinc finger BED domain-containing protein 4-like isoform X3 [Acanthochromis polyacanthus]XP_051806758.1 zinc finger BED domain-containing protein 4-like isoform X4 [Acanthochromis polyacanthus]
MRLQCFGHRLHLAIENAVKNESRVTRATKLCKELVGHFSHSWKKKTKLTDAQKELNLPEHTLITECQTRWGSRQKMVDRVLEQNKALNQVLSEDRKTRHLVPTWQDIKVLESINSALKPLQEFTDILSGEEYVSVSYLKPVLHLLKSTTLAAKEEDTDLTKTIKSKIIAYLEKHYSDPATRELLDVASLLNPRFKKDYITSPENVTHIKERVRAEMEEVVQTERRPQVSSDTGAMEKKGLRSLGSLLTKQTLSVVVQVEDIIEAELNSYLMAPVIAEESDPLAWWKIHSVNTKQTGQAPTVLCL